MKPRHTAKRPRVERRPPNSEDDDDPSATGPALQGPAAYGAPGTESLDIAGSDAKSQRRKQRRRRR